MTTLSDETQASDTLILTRSDVAALLSMDECIAAVEEAFLLHAEGRTLGPGVLGIPSAGGGFHIKAAGLKLERTWFAVKCNGNFSRNPELRGLPAIQGLVILCDADNGYPLAVLDSIEVTTLRTAAASAVAARHLARPDARVATICGCGNQGRAQLRALARVRQLEMVYAFDSSPARAARYAGEMRAELGLRVEAVENLHVAARASGICVTCTPAKRFLLQLEDVGPGCFIAAVGADATDKQELDPRLFPASTVVVDNLVQCAAFGDLHHAIESGLATRESVHAELAEVVAGRKPGRTSPAEITIFDSTGVALEDAAAAVAVYRRALEQGAGTAIGIVE